MAGMHGIGVSTPMAAAVAAMTEGLVGAEHIPKEAIFVMGTKSLMFARCFPCKKMLREGFTTSGQGTKPKVQVINADVQT
jgi:hypothetical protein